MLFIFFLKKGISIRSHNQISREIKNCNGPLVAHYLVPSNGTLKMTKIKISAEPVDREKKISESLSRDDADQRPVLST